MEPGTGSRVPTSPPTQAPTDPAPLPTGDLPGWCRSTPCSRCTHFHLNLDLNLGRHQTESNASSIDMEVTSLELARYLP